MLMQEERVKVLDAIIEEFLKPTPDESDLQLLFRKLNLEYTPDDLVNMKEIINSMDFVEDSKPLKKEDLDV